MKKYIMVVFLFAVSMAQGIWSQRGLALRAAYAQQPRVSDVPYSRKERLHVRSQKDRLREARWRWFVLECCGEAVRARL